MNEQTSPQQLLSALQQCRIEAQRYRLLAEQSTDMISRHSATPDWTFLDVSSAVTSLLGYAPNDLIGRSGYDLFHPEDADNLRHRAESVRYDRGVYTNTFRYRHKRGHYLWLETTSRTIRDAQGEPQEVVCVSRDVTEREQAQQSMRRLARVVEASSDLILFYDPDSERLTYLNESACLTLGQARESAAQLTLASLFTSAQQPALTQALADAARDGVWYGSLPMRLPQGERDAEVREIIAHRQRHDKTRIDYYSVIGRDITLKRKAQEEAKRRQLEMAHMSRLLSVGELATGLAHELNQPLAAILNYSRGALRRLSEPGDAAMTTATTALERIAGQALRAAEIIKRMRSFVRKTEYQRLQFSINEACIEVCTLLKQEIKDHRIDLQLDLDPDDPALLADKIQIEQVLLNLLRNAIEAYSDPGTRPLDERPLRLSTRCDGKQLLITLRDEAGGIPADKLQQLFEPFYTSKPTGLGMGLPISRTIIETHGGQLWAESDGQRVTHFYLQLPLKDK